MSITTYSRNPSNLINLNSAINSAITRVDKLNNDTNYIYLENKKTLKSTLKSKELLSFYHRGIKKYYADGASFIIKGIRQKFVNSYGIGYNKGKYLAFITNENGDPLIYFEEFEFEDDACEALFEKILKIKD